MSLIALQVVVLFLALVLTCDAVRNIHVRRAGRRRVWYGSAVPRSHVWVIFEEPAGTFAGWLDRHPYQPTNQPTTQGQRSADG